MVLDIGRAVEEGARRTLQRNGLMIVAAFFLLNVAGYFTGFRGMPGGPGMMGSQAMGNPVTLGLLGLILTLLSIAVSIVALRVFVTGETETVPDEAMKRNMGRALLHTIIGGIVFAILVAVGLILLIIPGIYLLLALFFWTMYVAVEDQGFYEALQSSWELTKGHKWRLLGLLLVIGVVNILLSIGGVFASFTGSRLFSMLVFHAFSAFGGVFALAAQARAYVQIAE